MGVEERDKYSGYLTTGHVWNGIAELNTRVPRLLLFFLAATFLFSVGYWYFMPSFPGVNSYSPGKLGIDQQHEIDETLKLASAKKTIWSDRLLTASLEEFRSSDELQRIVNESGPSLFGDNCATCHGQQGKGGQYFPNLTDSSWLWGGSPEDILKTLQVGINAEMEGTRVAQMPAFGATNVLDSTAITQVSTYVRSLSQPSIGDGSRVEELQTVKAGQTVFEQHCSVCHGVEAQGNTALGAPNLADSYWLYGGSQEAIENTLQLGRAGHMPAWQHRLDKVQLKILSLYVSGLSIDTVTH